MLTLIASRSIDQGCSAHLFSNAVKLVTFSMRSKTLCNLDYTLSLVETLHCQYITKYVTYDELFIRYFLFAVRWMYMRMATLPHLYILEPLSEHIFVAPLSSLAVQYIFRIPFYIFLPAHLVVWCLLDYVMASVIEVSDILIFVVCKFKLSFSVGSMQSMDFHRLSALFHLRLPQRCHVIHCILVLALLITFVCVLVEVEAYNLSFLITEL